MGVSSHSRPFIPNYNYVLTARLVKGFLASLPCHPHLRAENEGDGIFFSPFSSANFKKIKITHINSDYGYGKWQSVFVEAIKENKYHDQLKQFYFTVAFKIIKTICSSYKNSSADTPFFLENDYILPLKENAPSYNLIVRFLGKILPGLIPKNISFCNSASGWKRG